MNNPGQAGGMMDDLGMRKAFLGWQCRARQIAMREGQGRPDGAAVPTVRFVGAGGRTAGRIITVLNRLPEHSVLPEFRQMAKQTMDPAKVREAALRFLSAGYYQNSGRFSDVLTATFAADSLEAARLVKAGHCMLEFDANSHRFSLDCMVSGLDRSHPLHEATRLHNSFFNSALPPDVRILGFQPDWSASQMSVPATGGVRATGTPMRVDFGRDWFGNE